MLGTQVTCKIQLIAVECALLCYCPCWCNICVYARDPGDVTWKIQVIAVECALLCCCPLTDCWNGILLVWCNIFVYAREPVDLQNTTHCRRVCRGVASFFSPRGQNGGKTFFKGARCKILVRPSFFSLQNFHRPPEYLSGEKWQAKKKKRKKEKKGGLFGFGPVKAPML